MQTQLQKVLLIATNNPGKGKELRQLLAELPQIELVTPKEMDIILQIKETGTTYRANAALKAQAYVQASGLVTLADDSGLEVDALDGAPGLHSARYSDKPDATDGDRRALLLQNLKELPHPWTARFQSVVAIAVPGEEIYFTEGVCSGVIIPTEHGENGFGYDPIFYMPELERTMAELSDEWKNKISHRGKAVRAALPAIQEVFGLDTP
jgi:XTP/dITP diphosphohydrolase